MKVGLYAWDIQQVITDDLSELYISHTGTITKFPDPDPTENTDTTDTTIESESDHETTHASLPLKIILPLISVVLLTLLGVTLIIANIYKGRKDKRKSTNPLESLT